MYFTLPDSAGLPESFGSADTFEANLREVGWTDAARASALRSRMAGKNKYTTGSKSGMSDAVIDYHMRNIISSFGKEAGKQIATNLGIRIGVKTKTATSVRSSFFSNDGTHQYMGAVRSMRQRILSWAKTSGKTLPAGFENRSPSAIRGMFIGMAKGKYFKK